MYERILVPIDGSDTAAKGLVEAQKLASLAGSTLVLLHVVEVHPTMVEATTATVWEQLMEAQQAHARKVLEAASQQVQDAGLKAETHVVQGVPAARVCEAILDAARQFRCQLIAMGTHGRRGWAHALMGSDAEWVVRQSSVPVLLVRG